MLYIWNISQKLKATLINDEEGISAVEYALLGAFIIVGLAGIMPGVRDAITGSFTAMTTSLNPGGAGGGGGA